MVLKDVGRVLLAASGVSVLIVLMRLAWLAKSYSLGFDLLGLWKIWGAVILLWIVVTISGLVLLTVKRP